MEEFLKINPGLLSRFNKFIHFQDYSPEELVQIFRKMCAENGYEPTSELLRRIQEMFAMEFRARGLDFGNARLARNCFERIVANQSNRVAAIPSPSGMDLVTFQIEDADALLLANDVQMRSKPSSASAQKKRSTETKAYICLTCSAQFNRSELLEAASSYSCPKCRGRIVHNL